MSRISPSSSRFAFTLIELLTVIAIIGILAAILIPTVSKMRASGYRATAVTAMRQIGISVHLFSEENGGYLPGGKSQNLYTYSFNAAASDDRRLLFTHLITYVNRPRERNAGVGTVMLDMLVSRAHLRSYPGLLNANGAPLGIYAPNRFPQGIEGLPMPHPVFGSHTNEAKRPLRLSDLIAAGETGWLMQEADLEGGGVGNTNFPPQPIHGNVRHRLYADARVKALSLADSDLRVAQTN
jgi:prepilin-type N-terminal cleavage/methylation domain-containing protein